MRPALVSCKFNGLKFFKRVACLYTVLCQPVSAMFTTLATSNIRLFGYHQVPLSSYAQSNGPLYIHTPFTPTTPHDTHHVVGVPAHVTLNMDAAIVPTIIQGNVRHLPSRIGLDADVAIAPTAVQGNARYFLSRLGPFVQLASSRENVAGGLSSSQGPSFQGTYTEH